MSRIHEALKKAEQERATTQGGGTLPGFAATPVAEHPFAHQPVMDNTPAESFLGATASGHPSPGMPAFASPFSLDALLAGSASSQWTPDPATMLFLNGDDSARGAEEFRTLRSRLYHAREKMTLKKILVTSALPKEGKSFTCAAARTPGAAGRCRPSWAPFAHDAGHDVEPRPLRIFAGRKR